MTQDLILTEKVGQNLIITIHRPEKRNALNADIMYGLRDTLLGVATDSSVRTLIVRGEGKGFSAGIDFNFLASIGLVDGAGNFVRDKINEAQAIVNHIDDIEKPVIFAIHGFCFGMALELVLAGDFRIARADTQFGIQEVAVGFVPDLGGIARLTRLIGPIKAKELIMTARTIDANTAKEIQLVNDVVDDEMEGALALASELNKNAPQAVGLVKKLINRGQHMDQRTFMALEAIAQSTLLATDDVKEGIRAKIEKREAKFTGK
jgi:enoyl-CoA hydratase/carnithine racemase